MKIEDFVSDLGRRGVSLRVENGKIKFTAPPGAMVGSYLDALKKSKFSIIRYLTAKQPKPRTEDEEFLFQERAGFHEYCGEQTKEDAEKFAAEEQMRANAS